MIYHTYNFCNDVKINDTLQFLDISIKDDSRMICDIGIEERGPGISTFLMKNIVPKVPRFLIGSRKKIKISSYFPIVNVLI